MSKKLPDRIYRDLSISQRIRAAWEAYLRADDAELSRLSAPSEAGEYVIDRVSAALADLQVLRISAQIDILNHVVTHLVDVVILQKTDDREKQAGLLHKIETESGYAASIVTALKESAKRIGIDPESFQSEISPAHSVVQKIIDQFADTAPKDVTEAYLEEITGFLRKRHPKIACFQPAEQDE
jgi:hypothetical protein